MTSQVLLAAWTDFLFGGKFLGNELWRWAVLLVVLLGSLVVGKVISFFLQRQARRLQQWPALGVLRLLLKSFAGPVTMLVLAAGLYAASMFMVLTYVKEDAEKIDLLPFWLNVCRTIAVLAGAWFGYRLVDIIEFYLRRWTARTKTLLDDQLVPLIRKTLRVFVVIVAALFIAQNIFEWKIGTLVAGLGIGGLAFALAAKDTLANLFGSVTIFADRPFQMGERVVIKGHDGVVEEVGFRSTRIRTLTGHLVTIPNAVVANETVENIGRRPYIKRVLDVTITYDTPPEKVRQAVDIIREILEARKDHFHQDYPPRVYFNDFNPASLNIVVYYWFSPPDWWAYLGFNHEFNMELLKRFNEAGLEFAFPTQTLYLKQDSDLLAEVRPSSQQKQQG